MKHTVLFLLSLLPSFLLAQSTVHDTVEVELGNASRMILMIGDTNDLELLQEYDYNELFDDILHQLVAGEDHELPVDIEDTTLSEDATREEEDHEAEDEDEDEDEEDGEEDDDDWDDQHDWEDEDDRDDEDHYPCSRTNFLMVDVGINNFLQPETAFADDDPVYSVRPWGSWYVGINTVEQLRLSKQFSFDFRAGLSFYNFKFDEDDILVTKTPDGTVFAHDSRPLDFTKSKLSMAHVNLGCMAVINSRNYEHQHHRHWHWEQHGFRIGLGPYVGYRLDSYSKLQYQDEDGDKENERDRSNYHLNNLRYGLRLQIGVRNADFFFQYDLNELFKDDKGPRLNAYSFGISF